MSRDSRERLADTLEARDRQIELSANARVGPGGVGGCLAAAGSGRRQGDGAAD